MNSVVGDGKHAVLAIRQPKLFVHHSDIRMHECRDTVYIGEKYTQIIDILLHFETNQCDSTGQRLLHRRGRAEYQPWRVDA